MNGKLDTIRKWLENNRIFFELIVALSLTSMSIIVSINANQIAEYQNELIKQENQPIFVFNLTRTVNPNYTDNGSLDKGERIDINNIGKPAYNFTAEEYIFFDIRLYNKSDNYSEKKAYVPVTNYYLYSVETDPAIGLLRSFNMDYFFPINGTNYTGNYAVYCHINEDFGNYSQTQNYFGYIDLKRYFHITYSDIYGEAHDEIYYVCGGTSYKLKEKDKIDLDKRYNNGYISNYGFLEFRYFSPAEIIKILSCCSDDPESGKE